MVQIGMAGIMAITIGVEAIIIIITIIITTAAAEGALPTMVIFPMVVMQVLDMLTTEVRPIIILETEIIHFQANKAREILTAIREQMDQTPVTHMDLLEIPIKVLLHHEVTLEQNHLRFVVIRQVHRAAEGDLHTEVEGTAVEGLPVVEVDHLVADEDKFDQKKYSK